MLMISFGIIYGLSVLQVNESNNQVISFIISIVITLINAIIARNIIIYIEILQYLTNYETNFTKTNYQRSLAIKIILAQLVNIVIVTFIANFFIKNNVYEKGGLAEDVFYLGLSNSLVTPLLKIIDFNYFLQKILLYYYDRPCKFNINLAKKLYINQFKLNEVYSGI